MPKILFLYPMTHSFENTNYKTCYSELLEPLEVNGMVRSRVTEEEFNALRQEVGEKFFKENVRLNSRDVGAYTMIQELERRGVPLTGYRPSSSATTKTLESVKNNRNEYQPLQQVSYYNDKGTFAMPVSIEARRQLAAKFASKRKK